ncbi:hypothetical protein LguiB_016212 [Lonicera macranthoides]
MTNTSAEGYDKTIHIINISEGRISSYGFGTGYGCSAQNYANSGGSNNSIAAHGGYYESGREIGFIPVKRKKVKMLVICHSSSANNLTG